MHFIQLSELKKKKKEVVIDDVRSDVAARNTSHELTPPEKTAEELLYSFKWTQLFLKGPSTVQILTKKRNKKKGSKEMKIKVHGGLSVSPV